MSRALGFVVASLMVFGAGTARADRCPAVMILLDKSASMDLAPNGDFSTPTRLDLAKTALKNLVKKFGDQLPIGFATYSNIDGYACWDDINVEVPAVNGKAAEVLSRIAAVQTNNGTNTGNAIFQVAKHASLHDDTRPGSYIILVTDGAPNCGDGSDTDPEYTIQVIGDVADAGVKTFVIGFGSLPSSAASTMDEMAQASQVPCTASTCNGRKFYAAENQAGLDTMIEAVTSQIVGEFGGACDDSCYTNGCDSGESCVAGKCKPNPCAGFSACPAGAYCFWDGVSDTPSCKKGCKSACPSDEICNNGTCTPDPCSSLSCDAGQACYNGECITDKCSGEGCPQGMLCLGGQCRDNLCAFVQCPAGQTCTHNDGRCSGASGGSNGGGNGGGGGGRGGRDSVGCNAGSSGALDGFGLALAGVGLAALVLRRRRAARS